MIVTTTGGIDGYEVEEIIGIVAGEGVFGANVFKDMFASIRNFVGGRSRAYEKELEEARQHALKVMADKADKVGANAVLGISLDTEFIDMPKGGMMMVTATGTAAMVKKIDRKARAASLALQGEAGSRGVEYQEGAQAGKTGENLPPWYGGGLFEE